MFGSGSLDSIIRVKMDTSSVDQGSTNINKKMAAVRSEMRAGQTMMKGYGKSTDGLKAKQNDLARLHELQGDKVKALKNTYDDLAKNHDTNSSKVLNAQRNYNNALAGYTKMDDELKALSTELIHQESMWGQMENGLPGFSDRTGKMADNFGSIGKKMTMGVTLPVVGIGTAIVRTGMDFEKSMSKVQALSGASASEMAKMEAQAKELGETTVYSASQAADAQAFLAMAGWDVAAIYDAMPGLLDLAAAGQMELGRTADITSNIMQAFAINADEAGRVSDVLAAAASNSNTDIEMLGEAMEYAAPTANVFGWSVEETTAAMMKFGDAGIQGGKAGQAWSTSLQRLSKPTKAMRGMMDDLNISFFDAQGVMKPLPDLVGELENATKGMNDEQQANVLTTLFGNQAFKHWAILMEEGSDGLREQTTELENSEGAAKKMADTMLDNTAGSVVELKSAAEGLAISLSEHIMPAFTEVVKGTTDLVRWFGALDRDTQKYILTAVGIAAVLGPAAIVLSTTLKAVSYLTGGLARAAGAYGRYSASAKVATTHTTVFGNSAGAAGTKVVAANGKVGRFGGALGKIGGIASLAGLAMIAFGDDSGAGIGTAMLFAPEILKLGKGVLDAGKNALSSGGRFLGLGKNAGTASKGIGGLVRGIGGFGKAAGLLGGPVGWAVTAITTLGTVGYEVYQHYKDKVMPTFQGFGEIVMENGEKISEATAKSLDEYKVLHDDALKELNYLAWGSQEITDDIATTMTEKFGAMGENIRTSLDESYNKQLSDFEGFLKDYQIMSEDEEQKFRTKLDEQYQGRIKSAENTSESINDIWRKAAEENRALTDEEQKEINRLTDVMMTTKVQTVAQGSEEQRVIMAQLKEDATIISAEQATEVVKKSIEARDGAVQAANDQYDNVVAWAIQQRDETGLLTAEQAEEIINNANKQKIESISAAEDMHDSVIEEAKAQAGGHVEQINWSTGEILGTWDHFTQNMLTPLNWITKQVNKVLKFFGSDKRFPQIDPYATTQFVGRTTSRQPQKQQSIKVGDTGHSALAYQYGTSSQGHPEDGWAVTSEAGRELVHDPQVGTYLTNNKGPEYTYLHKGSSVLPAHHTKSLLSQYGFPAYETGIGNYFDLLMGGASSLVDGMWSGIKPTGSKGVFTDIETGILDTFKEGAIDFFKGLMPSFGFDGEGGSGAGYSFPAPFKKTSGFGMRWGKLHKGVDFGAPAGTPIPSQSAGNVIFSAFGQPGSGYGGYGNVVHVASGGGLSYLYAHNLKNNVSKGDNVRKGQIVGTVGNTGNSFGNHLHFEIRKNGKPVDPDSFGGALGGSGANGTIKGWITNAIKKTGVPMSWLDPLSTIAMKESGGNPRAINNWDINAKRGTPSMGLMQTIRPTFNAHKVKGWNDIFNPKHNTGAAINYIKSRYGTVFNTPGIKSMANGGKYRGYDHGGISKYKQLAWVSERDQEEYHLSMHPSDMDRSISLWEEIGHRLGMFEAMPSANDIQPADTNNYNRNNSNNDNILGKLVKAIENISRPVIQPAPLNVDGEELVSVLFKYIDEKLDQKANQNSFNTL